MKIYIGVILATLAFLSGWCLKSYQDRNDLRPKFIVGQKVTIDAIERYVDDGTNTSMNHWYREKRKYLSNGKAYIAGIEWWPTKNRKRMSYWIGSTDPTYKSFDGYGEEDVSESK